MALKTVLVKLKSAIFPKPSSKTTRSSPPAINSAAVAASSTVVGVLSFEVARLMTKLLHLSHSLSDSNVVSIRDQSISLEGVRKIVSGDETFLMSLACAELAESLGHAAMAVSRLSRRCVTASLCSFEKLFYEFADMGRDPHGWAMSCKDMEANNKKLERYVNVTTALYRELEELTMLENAFKKYSKQLILVADKENDNNSNKDLQKLMDLQQKIQWQRQQVKYLKDRSLWNKSFDAVVVILVRSVFTSLARLKSAFSAVAIGFVGPTSVPRSLSSSSSSSTLIHPTPNDAVPAPEKGGNPKTASLFFEAISKLLKPPETTLGGSALALHYANLIVVMEKMIKQPQLVGLDARDDLYGMLPESVRTSLRSRLRGVGFAATDAELAAEWKSAAGRILGWLLPMAQNMIRWQSERSFEQQNLVVEKTTNSNHQIQIQKNQQVNVMLLQTLFFADRAKTEAAITELLVGLNYIWRFEREMTAKALFNLQSPTK
ncbi:PREDICTED: uncharacterized protein LOC104811507 [Tarenaya hassleriana]|uniref:uncharacterized protein LOC104811507 n=1 Tax=Tarenaya hassleriana TaxID=28532 RepID=UPI00053C8CD8|nr:PREDICTED: uncharacterized protein LOC104811507 [Tarenaya hassleriana]